MARLRIWLHLHLPEGFAAPAPGDPIPECVGCGACCTCYSVSETGSWDAGWNTVRVPGTKEAGHWPDHTLVQMGGKEVLVYHRDDRKVNCCHLAGVVGVDAYCAIYSDRYPECRAFVAGSHNCEACRAYHGLTVSDRFRKLIAQVRRAMRRAVKNKKEV